MANGTWNPPPPPPGALPPPKKSSWLPKVLIGCGVLVVLGAIGIGVLVLVIWKASEGPQKAVEGFLAAAGSGDYVTAHNYFSDPLKRTQPLEVFTRSAQANQHLFQVTDTTFNNRSVDLNGAELSGTLTLRSGTTVPARFKLVKENGEWKFLSYSIGS